MGRYPELAPKLNKSPLSMICDSKPMAQLYYTFPLFFLLPLSLYPFSTFPYLWEINFSSQMIVEPSTAYWTQYNFIIFTHEMLELNGVFTVDSVQYIFYLPILELQV